MSRSTLLCSMLEFFFEKQSEAEKEARYMDGYRKKPENIKDLEALMAAQSVTMDGF